MSHANYTKSGRGINTHTQKMPWFRMYTDFLNDPKMIALAFEDQRHFIGVLALKSDGALEADVEECLLDRIVAQRLWIDHAIIREVKKRLIAAGLIDASWQPLAWNKRQFVSDHDSTAAERKRRERAKKAAASDDVTDASRVTNRDGHELVTRLDTDTDTDTEKDSAGKPAAPAVPERVSHSEKVLKTYLAECDKREVKAIPDDHPVRAYFRDAGITNQMAYVAWVRFKEEHTVGTRKAKRSGNWPALFASSVKDRWYKLWNAQSTGEATWTTEGLQARRVVEAQQQEEVAA